MFQEGSREVFSAAEMGKALRFWEPKGFSFIGGADGTRTRDPRRDRPVF